MRCRDFRLQEDEALVQPCLRLEQKRPQLSHQGWIELQRKNEVFLHRPRMYNKKLSYLSPPSPPSPKTTLGQKKFPVTVRFLVFFFSRFKYVSSSCLSSSTIFFNSAFSFGLRDLLRELPLPLLPPPFRPLKALIRKVFLVFVLVVLSCGSPSPRSRRVP